MTSYDAASQSAEDTAEALGPEFGLASPDTAGFGEATLAVQARRAPVRPAGAPGGGGPARSAARGGGGALGGVAAGHGDARGRGGLGGRARGPAQSSSVNGFSLAYEGFDPAGEGLREALTSTGNGYLCTRGTAEWEDADGVHYPGTYGHGVYNRVMTILGGVPVLYEDLVNLPNWLVLKLRIEGEDPI